MRRKLYLLSKVALLLVVIGFFMPVSCDLNGFQIAEFVKRSGNFSGGGSTVNWTYIMIHTVFWAAILGIVIGAFVLYEAYAKKLRTMDIALGGEFLVLAIGMASIGIVVHNMMSGRGKSNFLHPQIGAYLIGIGYVASVVLLIAAAISDDSPPDSSSHKDRWVDQNDFISCPYCAERIRKHATICRFCGRSLNETPAVAEAVSTASVQGASVSESPSQGTEEGISPDSETSNVPESSNSEKNENAYQSDLSNSPENMQVTPQSEERIVPIVPIVSDLEEPAPNPANTSEGLSLKSGKLPLFAVAGAVLVLCVVIVVAIPKKSSDQKSSERINNAESLETVDELSQIGGSTTKNPENGWLKGKKQLLSGITVLNGDLLTFVDGGTFQMGSKRNENELPVHKVSVSSFYISKIEVPQCLYEKVMGTNPSKTKQANLPVEQVDWQDAVEFCNKLSELEGLKKCYTGTGDGTRCDFKANGYRLPTEAEWEFAARGGNKSEDYTYAGADKLGEIAWYAPNSDGRTHEVGTKAPNELGLYDMSGNVYEWCWDWYDSGFYSRSPNTDVHGPSSGTERIRRSGSFFNYDGNCSISYRRGSKPQKPEYAYTIGFRIVRSAD